MTKNIFVLFLLVGSMIYAQEPTMENKREAISLVELKLYSGGVQVDFRDWSDEYFTMGWGLSAGFYPFQADFIYLTGLEALGFFRFNTGSNGVGLILEYSLRALSNVVNVTTSGEGFDLENPASIDIYPTLSATFLSSGVGFEGGFSYGVRQGIILPTFTVFIEALTF